MTERIAEGSPRFKARVAGLFELLEALTSGFGQVIVPGMLVVSGDAAATAANILANELSFRLCFAAALVAVACHIAWTLLLSVVGRTAKSERQLAGSPRSASPGQLRSYNEVAESGRSMALAAPEEAIRETRRWLATAR